jgi:hypothetical protein
MAGPQAGLAQRAADGTGAAPRRPGPDGREIGGTSASDDGHPSTARLAARALDQTRGLLRRELDLARAEADASLGRAGAALGLLAGALVIALAGLNVLSAALVTALTELGLEPAWAAVVVGLGLALVAGLMVARALARLRRIRLVPDRVAGNVRADMRTLKEASDD